MAALSTYKILMHTCKSHQLQVIVINVNHLPTSLQHEPCLADQASAQLSMHCRFNESFKIKIGHVVPHFDASTFHTTTYNPSPTFLFRLVPYETKRIKSQLCPVSKHLFWMFRSLSQVHAFTKSTNLHSQQAVESHAQIHLKVCLIQFQLTQRMLSNAQLCTTQ